MSVAVEPLPRDTRVAVVDDNPDDSYVTSLVLRQAGYTPVEIGPSESLDRMVERLVAQCQAAVCDHRLNAKTTVRFTGAELVYRITRDHRIPAVLNTTWASVDQDTSIRRWRSGIPSLLDKSDQTSTTLTDALALAAAETRGQTPRDRVGHPAAVQVVDIHLGEEWPTADVLVPAWRMSTVVRLPLEQITQDTSVIAKELMGRWLEAEVNCYAKNPRDLFFRNFKIAPELPEGWLEN